jgi:prepilin-type N-terminal cleavage/methylation domain-containing protein
MTSKKTKGFTLVELLVVIAIIVVLAGSLFLVINPARLLAKSRDSRRLSEVNELNKAFASALADQQITLPAATTTGNSCAGTTVVTGAGWLGGFTGSLANYIPRLPVDPRNIVASFLCYYGSVSATGWEIDAVIESLDNAPAATSDGGNANTCTTVPATACRFEVGTDLTLL